MGRGEDGVDAPELLEREAERARIELAVEGARAGRGSMLLIEGPAGIGKTALLGEAAAIAGEAMAALTARATRLEREFPFGAVRQLLEPPLRSAPERHRESLLEGTAAHAAPVLGLSRGGPAGAEAGFATLNGLYWLVSNLAEERPLLLLLDDAHWADRDSLRFLAFLAPRLPELPVALLLAARPEGWTQGMFAATASDPAAQPVAPAPLSASASARLVDAGFGVSVPPEFAGACHTATGGNPFYLRALLDELLRDRVEPSEQAAARVLALGPQAVGRVIVARLGALSPAAPRLVAAVAVLGDGADPQHAARLAGLEPSDARAAAAELAKAAILEGAEPLRFVHPIIRNAAYEDLGDRERATLHARAVGLLEADGIVERIPGHLLAVEPAGDPAVVATLRRAAADALAKGALDSAAAYLRRALAEPPPEDELAGVRLELGQAEAQLLDPTAIEHLAEAAAEARDHEQRVPALGSLGLARYLQGDSGGAADALREALEQIPPGSGGSPEAYLLLTWFMAGRAVPELVDEVSRRLAVSRRGPAGEPTPAEVARVMASAYDHFLRGDRGGALERIAIAEEALATVGPTLPLTLMLGAFQCVLGLYGNARSNFDIAFERARSRSSPMLMALALEGRTHLRWMTGDLSGAIADAEMRLRLGGDEWDPATTLVRVMLALCRIERGEVGQAAAALALPEVAEQRLRGMWGWLWLPYGRARLALARGDWSRARDQAQVAGERLIAIEAPSPEYLPWRSVAAMARARLEDPGLGIEPAREEVALARRTGSSRATGAALVATGSIARGAAGERDLAEAVELLRGTTARLEHGRALVELGAAIRRAGRRAEAREPLAAGMRLASECGAAPLAERAYTELRAAGARPRKPVRSGVDALTPSELRVARMAAEGRSNREIAQTLFVTVKTVEFHLGQTYRKLEISSREELGAALSGPDAAEPVASGS